MAESIKRGLPPAFVIAQASAHSNPTLGNEFKVVNWIRAASVLADGLDLNAAGQTNLLPEYTLHNLSDGDFTFSIPAAGNAALLIAKLVPNSGFDPADTANYNTKFRNPVFAQISQERLMILYANQGLNAVKEQLNALHAKGVF